MTQVLKLGSGACLSLANRTVLLTGAAGGLGAEATRRFLRAGAKVVFIDNCQLGRAKWTDAMRSRLVESERASLDAGSSSHATWWLRRGDQ